MIDINDVYAYEIPNGFSKKHNYRLVWASLFHVNLDEPFWSYDLARIIKDSFGENVRSSTVGQILSEFCLAGYVKSFKCVNKPIHVYMVTDKFRSWLEAVG